MTIGLVIVAIWIVATFGAAILVGIGRHQERPPAPVPTADDTIADDAASARRA